MMERPESYMIVIHGLVDSSIGPCHTGHTEKYTIFPSTYWKIKDILEQEMANE